jgi:DNA-binding HxlR family transcriptional regulator
VLVYAIKANTIQIESMKKYCKAQNISFCPVETSIELLSGKWKGRILWKLYNEKTMRFGELRKALGNITEKMLSTQLRELEGVNLVNRMVYTEVPPKVEYSLTEFGKSLTPILDKFAEWGVNNQEKMSEIFNRKR